MGIMKNIIILLFSIGFAAQAQTREDYDIQTTRSDIAKTVHIFPNPAVDFVHVRLDLFSAANVRLSLFNLIGNEVQVETEIVDEHEIKVRVKDLNAGYYLLALKDDQDRFRGTFKFLKR